MKPTDRDLAAGVAGLMLGALIASLDATRPTGWPLTEDIGWAIFEAILLAIAIARWVHETRRSHASRPEYRAACTCGWQSEVYDDPQDCHSAARAHVILGSHQGTP
ncbi:MAG TPA: hypothetical protein VI248_25975 [Kineosporiaceae bacterium]